MTQSRRERLTFVDALRGLVMVIMALDHTRDFFHIGAMAFPPEDLSQTTPWIFLTRWVTHICAPVFVLLAGVGAWCKGQRDASPAALSGFLASRGLWLVLVEITVMRVALNFSLSMQYPVLLLILWALGVSMLALAVLIHLPARALVLVSLALVVFHNTFDGVQAASLGSIGPWWTVLHQQGVIVLGGLVFFVAYPVLPWIGVMGLGYCLGPMLTSPPERRQRFLMRLGLSLIALFVVVRLVNVYGDPAPWSSQPSAVFTVLSFLRTTKYPPSLQFLLMTLGPALVALAWFDRRGTRDGHPLVVIGRVPFFFYVLHFFALHVVCAVMARLRYGADAMAFMFSPVPSMGGSRELFPPDFGYSLGVTYLVWIGVVVALYPCCVWFARVKTRRREWWLSYL